MKRLFKEILKCIIACVLLAAAPAVNAQINTDQVMNIGRNALYFEDYILSIQYFNQVIAQKPYLAEPYYYRAIAKISLDDFSGADADATQCIERNPFINEAYRLRAVARHNSHKFDLAIEDYKKCLEINPDRKDLMTNMGLCNLALKNYDQADSCLQWVLERDTTSDRVYMALAQLNLEKADTLQALSYLSRGIDIDKKNVQARLMRCDIYFSVVKDMAKALEDMDEVINLEPNNVTYYINRSIMRYRSNDYRGTMADLDYAVALDPDNLTAHYNRALLRTEVGANNKAIEDFNFVLERDPENYPALYNRTMLLINTGQYRQGISGLNSMLAKDKNDFVALYQRAMLYIETGQYKNALRDVNDILSRYPKFESGYMIRAQLKAKLGDKSGYESDLKTAVNVMKSKGVHYSNFNPLGQERKRSEAIYEKNFKAYADKQEQEALEKRQMQEAANSLEESVEDIKKRFGELLVVDMKGEIDNNVAIENDGFFDEKAGKRLYRNRSRGYIQDNNVEVQPQADFSLSYYSYDNKLNGRTHFMKEMSEASDMNVLPATLTLICNPPRLTEAQAGARFSSVDYFNGLMASGDGRAIDYFGRALDFFLLRNVDAAIQDATRAIEKSGQFALAYFLRYNAMSLKLSSQADVAAGEGGDNAAREMLARKERQHLLASMTDDMEKVVKLSPRNPYAYYNLARAQAFGNDLSSALINYSKAIELKPDLGEAYFNRGLIHMQLGDKEKGTTDLSKAGELGILPSYNILKRMNK